jgi:Ca2+/Na+ antiporter
MPPHITNDNRAATYIILLLYLFTSLVQTANRIRDYLGFVFLSLYCLAFFFALF